MPPDDQITRSTARCSTHTGAPSVAVCHSCGRALCLRCAVPVRGEVYGRECLSEVLGPDPMAPPAAVPARPRALLLDAIGLGFVVSIAGSMLPWTHFGVASGTFGAWGFSPLRWSTLATSAALLGLGAWLFLRVTGRLPRGLGGIALLGCAGAVMAGAVLHVLNPPPFTHAWLGPWVAVAGSSVSLSSNTLVLLRGRPVDSLTRP